MSDNKLTSFIKFMMDHRLYLTKKKKNSGEFATFLCQQMEIYIDDKVPEWFSNIATSNGIREDQVKQYVIEKCMEEHTRLCIKESIPKVPK